MANLTCSSSSVAKGIGHVLFQKCCNGDGDLVFEVGPEDSVEHIWAHTLVITAQSPVMRAELEGPFAEAKERRVRIVDINPKAFKKFLKLLYVGQLLWEDSDLPQVQVTGCETPPDQLYIAFKNACSDYFFSNIVTYAIDGSRLVLTFGDTKAAKHAIDTFHEGEVNGKTISVTALNDVAVDDADVARVEVFLAVTGLVDRYSVDGYEDVLATELAACTMWGEALAKVVTHCLSMPQTSTYRKALLVMCKKSATGSQSSLNDLRENFYTTIYCLDKMLTKSTSAKRAKMQILVWAQELINANWYKLKDKPEVWKIFELIPKELQGLLDTWDECPEDSPPGAKRQRFG